MSHEYVIGDIHGCFKEFQELVLKIMGVDPEAQFILVGDIIDRGKQTMEMLDWAMQNVNRENSRFKMILGNHEYEKIKLLDEYLAGNNKDIFCYDYYDFIKLIEEYGLRKEEILKIRDFFATLPVYYETDANLKLTNGKTRKQHYIVVHGGVCSYVNKNGTFKKSILSKSAETKYRRICGSTPVENIIQERNYFGNNNIGNTIVVHGHTPTIMRDLIVRGAIRGRIDYRSHDINVDCGIAYHDYWERYANLSAICLDNLEEYYLYDYPEELEDKVPFFKSQMLGKRHRRNKRDNGFSDLDFDELFK